MENKKTKLTISGSPKKSFKNFEPSKTKGKKTVVIDKHSSRPFNKGSFNKTSGSNFKRNPLSNTKLAPKGQPVISDFERRKLAEQRATKRLKGDSDGERKSKIGSKKRETKLTVSRALSDEIETRERSLASVKRARQKELKNNNNQENKESPKPIKRDINIPEAITVGNLQIEWQNNLVM